MAWTFNPFTSTLDYFVTGVSALAAVGSAPNDNGAVISGNTLTLEPADATHPGVVTAGTQTIGGAKTFASTIAASNLSGTNTGDVTLAAVGSSPSANGASIASQVLTLQPASSTLPGVITAATQSVGGGKTIVGNADEIQLIIKGNGTQTGNVVEVQNSGGTVQVGISKTGVIRANEIFAFGQGDITLTNCRQYNNTGTYTIDWQNSLLRTSGGTTIDWSNKQLHDNTNPQLSWSASGVALDQLTATTVPYLNSSKVLTSSAVTPTELGYVSGVSSSIQTQLNTKPTKSSGDINETSFSAANNTAVAANVTGLAFANGTVRAFDALVSVYVNATSSLFEVFNLRGIQKGSSWEMSQSATGDASGFVFSITTAGQVQYTNSNYSGFSAATVKFRAITTSV